MSERIRCELIFIRYVPDPVKDEFVNIGVLLRESGRPENTAVRFTRNWKRVRCLNPEADIEVLAGLETVLQRAYEQNDEPTLKKIHESFSQQVQLSVAKACVAESLPAEMEQAMRLYVEPMKQVRIATQGGRREAIRRQMEDAFRDAGVWDLIDKRIRVSQYTSPGDPLRIDFGYGNGTARMFHAVALPGDIDLAKVLAFTKDGLATGVRAVVGKGLEFAAVIPPITEAMEEEQQEHYAFAVKTMESKDIRVLTTSLIPSIAETAARELGL